MKGERLQFGHCGHSGNDSWPLYNSLKLKAGHRGHHGPSHFAIFKNVFQTSPENRSRIGKHPRGHGGQSGQPITLIYII